MNFGSRSCRQLVAACGLGLALSLLAAVAPGGQQRPVTVAGLAGEAGGRLVVSLRAEPARLNPVMALDRPSKTVLRLLMAELVQLDPQSQQLKPSLLESWTLSEDHRRFRLKLRPGLRFSDGEPLDADDILFTFQALADEAVGSPYREFLFLDGEPVVFKKIDAHTVDVETPRPYAAGALLFDSVAILPEHRLRPLYQAGKLDQAWTLSTPPGEIVGAGPFRFRQYLPGERLVLERNPFYWKQDAAGQPLPYLAQVVFLFVRDEAAQVLRFQAGEIDLIEGLDAESFALLEGAFSARGSASSRPMLRDLGPSLAVHFLFFNLNRLDEQAPAELRERQEWFRQRSFRAAVARGVDREGIVRLVYQGRATAIASPLSPANRFWYNPAAGTVGRSLEQAEKLLMQGGFSHGEDGKLRDAQGRPVAFSLAFNAGNDHQKRMAAVIQEDLRVLGMGVTLVPLEFRSLVDRILHRRDFDAAILALSGDLDPNTSLNTWSSSGSGHFWRLQGEAEEWEQEIDRLLQQQKAALDLAERKRLFDRVQEILAEQQPFIFLISPNVLVGARRGLGNFRPTNLDQPTLWNAEELFWQGATAPTVR